MFLILGALRNFNLGMTTLRKGEWNKGVPLGHDPQGKVLGILGMGGIGRNLRDKAKAFGYEAGFIFLEPFSEIWFRDPNTDILHTAKLTENTYEAYFLHYCDFLDKVNKITHE